MASKPEISEEESFIILGSSPGTSLDIKCNGIANGTLLDKAQIEDAMKDLSMEASASYKAHFNLAECPSPGSMMVASNIITDEKTTEELQKRFGELLDENTILKDTLKQNNDSLKEQFMLISSCQDDMLKTTMQHKEKFKETKALIEKLRLENKKLKQEMTQLAEAPLSVVSGESGEVKGEPACPSSGPSSALEFVTSPDDDTVDKLTAQLELVEKQRRQVITENEKLSWQKESLEHIVDATTKERDILKEKLKQVELQLSSKITEHETELRELNFTIEDLQGKLDAVSVSPEEISKRDAEIKRLEEKVSFLVFELKNAKLEILKSENVKMEVADLKCSMQDMMKIQKDNLQEMQIRLRQATTTLFQPVRLSVGTEPNASSEFGSFTANVKLYDRALKHLAEMLNKLTHGLSDSLVETLGVILSLHDYMVDRNTEAHIKPGLDTLKQQLERQQCDALTNIGQVRGTMTIFEGIFKDYKEVLMKTAQEKPSGNMEALTTALMARGKEIQSLEGELNKLRGQIEDTEHMKVQLDLYRSDFEAERQAREKMASEKDSLHTDLRKCQRRNEELTQQLEEVRRLNPGIHRSATSKPIQAAPAKPAPASKITTGNMVKKVPVSTAKEPSPPPLRFDCPVCDKPYKTLYLLQQHLDHCIPNSSN